MVRSRSNPSALFSTQNNKVKGNTQGCKGQAGRGAVPPHLGGVGGVKSRKERTEEDVQKQATSLGWAVVSM